MKRGMIYWVNLEPTDPPEFGKTRPGLIISNSEQNSRLPTVVILPISSRAPQIWPLRIKFKMPNNRDSFAVLPGIRQVSKSRLTQAIGFAPKSLLDEVDQALAVYLSD